MKLFCFPFKEFSQLEKEEPAVFAQVFKALVRYANGEEVQFKDEKIKMVFDTFKDKAKTKEK